MPQTSLTVDVKRRRLLLMEGTEPFVIPARLLEGHVSTHQLNQVDPLADFFSYIGRKASGHEGVATSPRTTLEGPISAEIRPSHP
jgi:hypothetical protein